MGHIHDSVGSHVPLSWAEFIFSQLSVENKIFYDKFLFYLRMLPFTGDTQNGANISFMIPYFNFIANRFSTLSKMASVHVNRFSRDRKTKYTFVQSSFNIMLVVLQINTFLMHSLRMFHKVGLQIRTVASLKYWCVTCEKQIPSYAILRFLGFDLVIFSSVSIQMHSICDVLLRLIDLKF